MADKQNQMRRNTILFISHEASSTGAPGVLLSIMRWLRNNTSWKLRLVLRSGGPLEKEFRKIAEVHLESEGWNDRFVRDVCVIYSNTGTNGLYLRSLPVDHIPIITHMHELQQAFEWSGEDNSRAVLTQTSHFIACSNAVRSMLQNDYHVNVDMTSMVPEAIAGNEVRRLAADKVVSNVRKELGFHEDVFIVAGCGNGEARKGTDLFIQLARACSSRLKVGSFAFIWIGKMDDSLANKYLAHDIEKLGLSSDIRFLGQIENPFPLLAACDLFCLPSREDPFPLVMLESGALGKPTLAFRSSGGAEEYCEKGGGFLAPYLDIDGMADHIERLINDRNVLLRAGDRARQLVEQDFYIDVTGPAIEKIIQRVSIKENCLMAGAAQVFIPFDGIYSEENSACKNVRAHQWNRLQFRFFANGGSEPWRLRVDPINQTSIVEIASIALRSRSDGVTLWTAETLQDFSIVSVDGTAIQIPDETRFKLLNVGSDAILYLPEIKIALESKEYQLDVVLRIDCDVHPIGNAHQRLLQKQKLELEQVLATHYQETTFLLDVTRLTKQRSLCIWGTGSAGKRIAGLFSKFSIEFKAFIDSKPERTNCPGLVRPVLSPNTLNEIKNTCFVVIASQSHQEICTALNGLGFVPGRDYLIPAWLI
jgi:glycosyltransferase involved in cell wall biosynthesis